MNSEANSLQLEGITYRDELPIAWEPQLQLPSAGEIHRFNCENEELLQTLLMLDETAQDNEDEVESADNERWRRLEGKVNILLGLVGELLTADTILPTTHALQLGVEGLCVLGVDDCTPQPGQIVKVRLFLAPKFPHPLQLVARVSNVYKSGFTLAYCEFDAPVQDLLDRYVFRQHRRAIALARRSENL